MKEGKEKNSTVEVMSEKKVKKERISKFAEGWWE